MSHTDKDMPSRVKAADILDTFTPRHSIFCDSNQIQCDLPPEASVHNVNRTYCYWSPSTNMSRDVYGEIYHSMPAHGCTMPRCTRCKSKRALKRRTRNNNRRQLDREIKEELY